MLIQGPSGIDLGFKNRHVTKVLVDSSKVLAKFLQGLLGLISKVDERFFKGRWGLISKNDERRTKNEERTSREFSSNLGVEKCICELV